jgi:hypothetical protein
MAIKTVVRAAVTVSIAVALSVDVRTGTMWKASDLPRSMLKAVGEASGCGKELPGYYQFPGLRWATSWGNTIQTWNTSVCAQNCDDNRHCIAFTAKKPRHGKMICSFYRGLQDQPDHRAMSYMRCVTGFDCQDGFQFARAGAWKGGTTMDNLEMESKAECRLACYENRGCVGFTYRMTKTGESFCYHFENEDNKDGPTRDMRANTYSKCGVFEAAPELDEPNQTEESADDQIDDPAPEAKDEQGEAKDEQGEDPAPEAQDEQGEAPASAAEDAA